MYAPFQTGGNEYPSFRASNMFESFADFMTRHTTNLDEFIFERCVVTGEIVSQRESSLIQAMIRMVASETVGTGDRDLLNPPTQSDIEGWAETILDRIAYRLTMTSRPSPLFAVSGGRIVLSHMSKTAQTVALLSMLFLDPVNTKAVDFQSSDLYIRICAVYSLADEIGRLFAAENTTAITEIHSLLVELDAKYSIASLTLIEREKTGMAAIKKADIVGDLKTLRDWLVVILNYRDQYTPVVEGPQRWTQVAFSNGMIDAVKRTSFSNVFAAMAKENKPSNRHIKKADESKPKNKGGRPVKDQARADRRARMSAMMASGGFAVRKESDND